MATAARPRVLAAYRQLLTTSRAVFGKGSEMDLETAKAVKQMFLANSKETDPKKIEEMLKGAAMGNDILRKKVFRFEETDEGAYRVDIREEQTVDYRNMKTPPGGFTEMSGGCCQEGPRV